MPTFDMITSLASMTSRASWASKSYLLGDFPAIRNLSSLNDLNDLNSVKGLNDLNSFILSKNRSLNVEWIITNQLFYGFLALFLLETVEATDVLSTKFKGHKSASHDCTDTVFMT